VENLKLKKDKPILIAIDATAGSGSTSLAQKLAQHYQLRYLDTGKVYRWCALQIIKKKPKNKIKFLKKRIKNLNLKELQNKKLIDNKVAQVTSQISSDIRLRKLVFNYQRKIAYDIPPGYRGSVLNGRDITHNIVPDATFKFYVTASILKRSQRRYKELRKLGKKDTFKEIVKSLKKRDKSDKNRGKREGKLIKTKDSWLINNTRLSITECFLKVKKIIDRKLNNYHGRNRKIRRK
jgi:cytidylate kinase